LIISARFGDISPPTLLLNLPNLASKKLWGAAAIFAFLMLSTRFMAVYRLDLRHFVTIRSFSSTTSPKFVHYAFSPCTSSSSLLPISPISPLSRNFSATPSTKRTVRLKPLRPCVAVNPAATEYLSSLVENSTADGVLVKYEHSTSGQPRMVFGLGFMHDSDMEREEAEGGGECVWLEVS